MSYNLTCLVKNTIFKTFEKYQYLLCSAFLENIYKLKSEIMASAIKLHNFRTQNV